MWNTLAAWREGGGAAAASRQTIIIAEALKGVGDTCASRRLSENLQLDTVSKHSAEKSQQAAKQGELAGGMSYLTDQIRPRTQWFGRKRAKAVYTACFNRHILDYIDLEEEWLVLETLCWKLCVVRLTGGMCTFWSCVGSQKKKKKNQSDVVDFEVKVKSFLRSSVIPLSVFFLFVFFKDSYRKRFSSLLHLRQQHRTVVGSCAQTGTH